MLRFELLPDGAFVCGDTETGVTVYSYPTSINANAAKRNPETAARSILREQPKWRGFPDIVAAYDKRNWAVLDERAQARMDMEDKLRDQIANGQDVDTKIDPERYKSCSK